MRKREKLKLEYTRVYEKILFIKLKPLEASLAKLLDLIEARDTNEIFTEPVDLEEVNYPKLNNKVLKSIVLGS